MLLVNVTTAFGGPITFLLTRRNDCCTVVFSFLTVPLKVIAYYYIDLSVLD